MIPANSINCEVDFGWEEGGERGEEGFKAVAALEDLVIDIVEGVAFVFVSG